ncbi:OsmC family protein [Chondrocystis sp. NIES-4102]|nr:OsmC family protein [Chondrocystis sp. NIES-4102]
MANHQTHHYQVQVVWTGNNGYGTNNYQAYDRSHSIIVPGKPTILGSSDVAFRGDPTKYNPEELLLASVSSCHMLWYLHLCATNCVVVTSYLDQPIGIMQENKDGSGKFVEVILKPVVTITANSDQLQAAQLHLQVHQYCFIGNSVNFPVKCQPFVQID